MTRTRARAASLALATIASLGLAATGWAAGPRETAAGSFRVLATGEGTIHEDGHGVARIVRDHAEGTTTVHVRIVGLVPDTDYGAHLHDAACSAGGGGHYQDDVNGPAELPNELWPAFTTDAHGRARVAVTADWLARPEAESVVVHAPGSGGAKVLCAQL